MKPHLLETPERCSDGRAVVTGAGTGPVGKTETTTQGQTACQPTPHHLHNQPAPTEMMMATEPSTTFFTGVQPGLTPDEVAANDAMPERRVISLDGDDFKHISLGVKQATIGVVNSGTRKGCHYCGNESPKEIWSCCSGEECYGCESCKDTLVKQTGGRNGAPPIFRCCFAGCNAKSNDCLGTPRRNKPLEAKFKEIAEGASNLTEALHEEGMQENARRSGEDEAPLPAKKSGILRKKHCTEEEWAADEPARMARAAAAKERKRKADEIKAKAAAHDPLKRQNTFLRNWLYDYDKDMYDVVINQSDLEEAAWMNRMEMESSASDSGDTE